MKFFKWHIISKDTLETYQNAYVVQQRVVESSRWFSGWEDLKTIWGYLLGTHSWLGIDHMRADYAKLRDTTVYGEPLKKTTAQKIEYLVEKMDFIHEDRVIRAKSLQGFRDDFINSLYKTHGGKE